MFVTFFYPVRLKTLHSFISYVKINVKLFLSKIFFEGIRFVKLELSV